MICSKGFALAARPSHPRREADGPASCPIHNRVYWITRFNDYSPQAAAFLIEPIYVKQSAIRQYCWLKSGYLALIFVLVYERQLTSLHWSQQYQMGVKGTHHPRINFGRLLRSIQPSDGEVSKAKSYSLSCRKRLNSSFDLKAFKVIGSHARKEAIRHYSDLDFIAVLSKNEAKWGGKIVSSDTLTKKVSQDLNNRYVQTSIRRDAQAIVLNFGNGQHSMDVVPALFHHFDKQTKRPVYHIPDGQGGWLETSPEAHNAYIKRANARAQGKLAKTSQLIRCWKHSRSATVPISSFYISLLLSGTGICIGAKSYPMILYSFFEWMYQNNCSGFSDPVGIAGNVYAAKTSSQLNTIQSSISTSFNHAQKAILAENSKDFAEANRQWNIVFNGLFI